MSTPAERGAAVQDADSLVEPHSERAWRSWLYHLGREDPLPRIVEGGDVERERVPQRRRWSARRERVVDVDDVQRPRFQQPFDRVPGLDPQHLVPAPLELLGDGGRELRRRVGPRPADREDLGNRERLGGHRRSIRAASAVPWLLCRLNE